MPNHRIIIVGANGFGRQILNWMKEKYMDISTILFVDDNLNALDGLCYTEEILSTIDEYIPAPNDHLYMGIIDPIAKIKAAQLLESKGAAFQTFIHPSSYVGNNVDLGCGSIIGPHCILTCDITTGGFVTFTGNCGAGHDVTIGIGTSVTEHVNLLGHASIGTGVLLKSHVIVIPHATVGDYAIVLDKSIVLRKVKPNTTVFGIPARAITRKEGSPDGSRIIAEH